MDPLVVLLRIMAGILENTQLVASCPKKIHVHAQGGYSLVGEKDKTSRPALQVSLQMV